MKAVSAKDKLTEEAIYWVSKLHSGQVGHEEKLAFSEWLNRSQAHEHAFDEINATWSSLGKAEYLPDVQEELGQLSQQPKKSSRRTLVYALQAACFVLVLIGGFSYFSAYERTQPATVSPADVVQLRHETAAGEDRLVELPDGSTIHLNTRSSIEVRYSQARREVVLLKGEAHFEVMPDKSRPFVVKISRTSVTAVGTAFNIFKRANESTVTITEGVVRVVGQGDEQAEGMLVPAHRKVNLIDDSIQAIEDTSAIEETAWQQKQIIFRSETIDVVIKELNRYLEKTVVIQDPTIKSLRLTGTFDLKDPEAVLKALILSYNLEETNIQGYRFINRREI